MQLENCVCMLAVKELNVLILRVLKCIKVFLLVQS